MMVFPFFVPPFAAAEQHDIHKKIMGKKKKKNLDLVFKL